MIRKQDTESALRIIRKKNSRQGQLLEYLKLREEGGSDLAMAAITSYYLPDCLYDSGVREVELQRAVVDAIAQLEVQILKLKHNYGMGQFPQVVVVNPIGGVTASGMLSHSSQAVGANIYPNPAVSFFGENEASTTVEVSQDKELELGGKSSTVRSRLCAKANALSQTNT